MIRKVKRILYGVLPYLLPALAFYILNQHLANLSSFLFKGLSPAVAFRRLDFLIFFLLLCLLKLFVLWVWGGLYSLTIDLAGERNSDSSLRGFCKSANKFYLKYLLMCFVGYFAPWRILQVLWIFLFALVLLRKKIVKRNHYPYFPNLIIVATLLVTLAALGPKADFVIWVLLSTFLSCKDEDESRVIVVNPLWTGILPGIASWLSSRFPPFFIVLLSCTEEKFNLKLFNATIFNPYVINPGDLVAITCFSSNAYRAYAIAKRAQESGAKVVMGGPHVTAFPNEALSYCDSVVLGEAELVWSELLSDFDSNNLKQLYKGEFDTANVDKVYERMDELSLEQSRSFVESARGCKFACEHCAIPFVCGRKIRYVTLEKLLSHIKRLSSKHKHITFLDNNIYSNPNFSRKLFAGLKELGVSWEAGTSIDIADNVEDLRMAKESGAKGFLVGYELVQPDQQDHKQGKYKYMQRYIELTKRIKKYGIKLKATFMYGFDNSDFKYSLNLMAFAAKINANWSPLFLLTPLPGTVLYNKMLESDRITVLNWRKYDTHHCTFLPKASSLFVFLLCFNITRFFMFFLLSRGGRFLFFLFVLYIFFAH